jgi:hypothetical protein
MVLAISSPTNPSKPERGPIVNPNRLSISGQLAAYSDTPVLDLTLISKRKEKMDEIFDVLSYCKLDGFGGRCFAAAQAINEVLFHKKGCVVLACNVALGDTGLISGHAAVRYLGRYWDSEGDHSLEHIRDYARLEVDDKDASARYQEFTGKVWDETTAKTVRVSTYPEGMAIWPAEEADYNAFSGKLFEALKEKRATQVASLVDGRSSVVGTVAIHQERDC